MKFVTAPQLQEKISVHNDLYILDIRDTDDYSIASIKGSVNIPRLKVEENIPNIPKTVPIAIICRFGTKSSGIARLLEKSGYDEHKIYVLDEGIISWAVEVDPNMPSHLL